MIIIRYSLKDKLYKVGSKKFVENALFELLLKVLRELVCHYCYLDFSIYMHSSIVQTCLHV